MNIKQIQMFLAGAAMLAGSIVSGFAVETKSLPRVVSLGTPVTEAIYALGLEDVIVAVDDSSLLPREAIAQPKVGYFRMVAAEGILSLQPDLIITTSDWGPAGSVAQIRASGVQICEVDAPNSIEGVLALIDTLGEVLDSQEQALELRNRIAAEYAQLQLDVAQRGYQPKIAFFMAAPGQGGWTAGGAGTKADALIHLIGGHNVFASFNGYKQVSAEAVIGANPDVIIVGDPAVISGQGKVSIPPSMSWMSVIPAVKQDHLYVFSLAELLGFGPSLIHSAREVNALVSEAGPIRSGGN